MKESATVIIRQRTKIGEFLKGLKPEATLPGRKGIVSKNLVLFWNRKVTHDIKSTDKSIVARNGKDVYMKTLDYVLTEYGRFQELKNQKFNKMKSRALGTGYHISENREEIPKGMEHKTQLERSRKWVNTNLSAANMSSKLVEVGGFYNRVENRKILGAWDSGAEVEFDIPTRPSRS